MFLSAKTRWILLAVTLIGIAVMGVMEFSSWHQLEAVTLDGEPVENWDEALGLQRGRSILEQPVEHVAAEMLQDTAVVRVDVSYALPDRIDITTNRFTPVCYALDAESGRMYGLNHQGRFVPLKGERQDWEHPILTGITASGLYELARDSRVSLVIPQLRDLADDNVDLYRLIDEIDLHSENYTLVTLSGLTYRLKMHAADLHQQISTFIRSVERYPMEIDEARLIDLRFDNLIVQKGGIPEKTAKNTTKKTTGGEQE
ncbi:hypothetical protein GF377_05490 [candidate division GN15 bacterium]|nr:hypothetical protein [candidate division GN15 bacterium]